MRHKTDASGQSSGDIGLRTKLHQIREYDVAYRESKSKDMKKVGGKIKTMTKVLLSKSLSMSK